LIINTGTQEIELRRSLRFPAVFIRAHPLNSNGLAHGARKQCGIF